MNLKENDNLPNSEVFVLEKGEPVKKNIEDLIKNKLASGRYKDLADIEQLIKNRE